jgi:protein-L-isoaspartate O-methyltransferase
MTRKQRLLESVDAVYEQLDGDEIVHLWRMGQGVMSAAILTAASPEKALEYVIPIREKLYGKVVVEIGAGVGWMAIMMARYCKELYAIEAEPSWSWVFTEHLYRVKPPNLTWIFGSAENMVGKIKADVVKLRAVHVRAAGKNS